MWRCILAEVLFIYFEWLNLKVRLTKSHLSFPIAQVQNCCDGKPQGTKMECWYLKEKKKRKKHHGSTLFTFQHSEIFWQTLIFFMPSQSRTLRKTIMVIYLWVQWSASWCPHLNPLRSERPSGAQGVIQRGTIAKIILCIIFIIPIREYMHVFITYYFIFTSSLS